MKKILVKNGRVWDGENFFFADVLIEEMLSKYGDKPMEERSL